MPELRQRELIGAVSIQHLVKQRGGGGRAGGAFPVSAVLLPFEGKKMEQETVMAPGGAKRSNQSNPLIVGMAEQQSPIQLEYPFEEEGGAM